LVQLRAGASPASIGGTVPFVAVVDDEEPVRKALKRLLRAAGLEAEGYASGKDFLAAERRPDCVVLDLHMPSMSGQQLLREIRGMSFPVPVVVITAHDTPETREQCLLSGAAAYLRKPLDDRLLLNAISAALSKAAMRRA
jgi:FixJ family two-component response regulator